MAKKLSNNQKKDWAKILYTKENLTQQEIADRVGTTRTTVNRWINSEKWEELKTSITITREEQLKNLYRQLSSINSHILNRDQDTRFPTSAEADTIAKISNAISKMETEVGLSNIIEVFKEFLSWLRLHDLEKTKEITPLFDSFVKTKLE